MFFYFTIWVYPNNLYPSKTSGRIFNIPSHSMSKPRFKLKLLECGFGCRMAGGLVLNLIMCDWPRSEASPIFQFLDREQFLKKWVMIITQIPLHLLNVNELLENGWSYLYTFFDAESDLSLFIFSFLYRLWSLQPLYPLWSRMHKVTMVNAVAALFVAAIVLAVMPRRTLRLHIS